MPRVKNEVELVDAYGSDVIHALSAWTSTSRDLTPEKEARIEKLLTQLASDGHETPFEKSCLHFLVSSEIASHIHMLKHRIGVSINGESARYKEIKEDRYYVPADWPVSEQIALQKHSEECWEKYHGALARLTPIIGRKRAKESARYYLGYSTVITYDVMFNFRSFFHFLVLRKSEHAQSEIHDIAAEMLKQVQEKRPEFARTLRALLKAAEKRQNADKLIETLTARVRELEGKLVQVSENVA